MKAQQNSNDELGWAMGLLLEDARGGHRGRPCPKAISRAHARLIHERQFAQLAYERDRALCASIDRAAAAASIE